LVLKVLRQNADSREVRVRPRSVLAGNVLLFAAALTTAGLTTHAADWQPVGLLLALVVLAVGSDLLGFSIRGLHLSGAFAAIVLASVLLGPAPAILVALGPILVPAVRTRPSADDLVSNLATFAIFPLCAALAVKAVGVADQNDLSAAGLTFAVFMGANLLNFVCIYTYRWLTQGWKWGNGLRSMYAPVLPAQVGIGVVTVAVVYIERHLGPDSIILFAPIVLTFQWLLRTAVAAFERGEQLEARNRELASLQFGLISSMLKTLALRDNMTARHSAAVARYARAMAQELALPAEEQELIHTAALFHDIGKFIFPDSILLSKRRLTEAEFDLVRQHPAVGAEVIAGIEGYDAVADIVLHHHERIDGLGYPTGIMGDEIPLGSRIIAVADTYDVITARDTYQEARPMTEAFTELRRSAGTQLDADLVELFISLMLSRGVVFRHGLAEDFEAELALERRATAYANPRKEIAN
jgi:putative nucleotidyltransferase with HDIG domain